MVCSDSAFISYFGDIFVSLVQIFFNNIRIASMTPELDMIMFGIIFRSAIPKFSKTLFYLFCFIIGEPSFAVVQLLSYPLSINDCWHQLSTALLIALA